MLQKYSRVCCPEAAPVVSVPCPCPTKPLIDPTTGYVIKPKESVPESIRLRRQVDACPMFIRPGPSSSLCVPGGEEGEGQGQGQPTQNTLGIGTPGTAPVEVKTFSAGEYMSLLGAQTLNAANNSFNPDTRFQQYFPETVPAPERVVCPERIPNPVTVRDRGCVPQALFAPSVPGGPIA
jgi:hypothetical protein